MKLRLGVGWTSPDRKGPRPETGDGGTSWLGWCSRTCVWQEPGHQGLIWGNTLTLGDFGACAGHIPGKNPRNAPKPRPVGGSASQRPFSPDPKRPFHSGFKHHRGTPIPSTQTLGRPEGDFRLGGSDPAPILLPGPRGQGAQGLLGARLAARESSLRPPPHPQPLPPPPRTHCESVETWLSA